MEKKAKRLGVLRMLDTTGVVDEYVYTLLDGMRKVTDERMVFCAKKTDPKTIEKLAAYATCVYCYDNEKFADGCFVTECNYKIMSRFDEVIIFDDTLYGPVYPLEDAFISMRGLNVDFWGLTRRYEKVTPEGYPIPGGLQGYFLVLEKSVLQSGTFAQYWEGARDGSHFMELLIRALEYAGFHWDSYLDTSVAKGRFPDENFDPTIWFALDLLKRQQAPFVCTKAIANTYFLPGGDEIPRLTFEYLRDHTDYDTDLIWQHLLRTNNILDIKTALHLETVLPSRCAISKEDPLADHTAAVIAHLYYPDQLLDCMDYLEQVPERVDVFVVSANEETRNSAKREILRRGLHNFRVMEKNNRGRDFSALLTACHRLLLQYDYLCFIHDKKSHAHSPVPSGRTWFYNLWSCMLKSGDYIENILRTFEENPRLGLMVPPEPCHSEAIAGVGFTWGADYEAVGQLLHELDADVPLDRNKHPFTLGTSFWCRTEAMKPLFERKFRYEDFPEEPMAIDGTICHALERIFGYVAQSRGYYTENVMCSAYAGLRLNKLNNYTMQTMTIMREENIWDRKDGGVVFDPHKAVRYENANLMLTRFGFKHMELYIYGAGVYGKQCCQMLQAQGVKVAGFIVSDQATNPAELMGVPVRTLKGITPSEKVGIVVALKAKFRAEVVPMLLEKGIEEIAFYPALV